MVATGYVAVTLLAGLILLRRVRAGGACNGADAQPAYYFVIGGLSSSEEQRGPIAYPPKQKPHKEFNHLHHMVS